MRLIKREKEEPAANMSRILAEILYLFSCLALARTHTTAQGGDVEAELETQKLKNETLLI